EPRAERFALFEDDVLAVAALRNYLDRSPYPEQGYLNLYVYPSNASRLKQPGWNLSNQRGFGAQALVFDRSAAEAILTARNIWDCRCKQGYGPGGYGRVDGVIADCLKQRGIKEYIHNPSLTQHIGNWSTLGADANRHEARSFPGESFDALTL